LLPSTSILISNCDITIDILKWEEPDDEFDIVLASPPCEKFTTMGFQYGYFDTRWNKERRDWEVFPVRPEAFHAMSLVKKAVELIQWFAPRFWAIENPAGILRKLDIIPWERTCIWYCHYGEFRAKPTDLWGNFPMALKPPCHNRQASHAPDCCCTDHIAAPRGSRTGTQGMGRAESAKIPYQLAEEFCIAAENAIVVS
jgi:hypothetical protein